MSDRPKIGLDNPAFQGRLRKPLAAQSLHAPISPRSRRIPAPTVLLDPVLPAQLRPIAASSGASEIRLKADRPGSMDGMIAKKHPAQLSRPRFAPQTATHPDLQSANNLLISTVSAKPVNLERSQPLQIIAPQPFARPAHAKLQRSQVLHRRAVQGHFKPQSPRSSGIKAYSKVQLTLVAMAGFIFLVGIIVSAITLQTNNSTKSQVAAISSKVSNSEGGAAAADAPPTETKPSASQHASYKVAPLLPKYVKIGSIGVSARVTPMGINTKGELQAPYNIFDAGWYNASARPGDSAGNGAMLIDGHVHGPTLPGVFNDLKKVAVGSTIKVVRGDDTIFTYKVVKVQNYDAQTLDMGMALASAQPGVAGLNIMTCGGPYDKVNGEYTQRTIVFAVLQS